MWQNCIEQFHILGILAFLWRTVIVNFYIQTKTLLQIANIQCHYIQISKYIHIFDYHPIVIPLIVFLVIHSHYCFHSDALNLNVNVCLHPAETMQRQVVGSKRYVYWRLFLSFYGHDVHEILICYGHNICPCQVQIS